MKKIIILILITHCALNIENCFSQWVQQQSGTSASFGQISFINRYTGWICGSGGTILKTTNAGQNWIAQNSGVTVSLYDIHPVDSQYVYCVGIFETILKSTNGGDNWTIIRTNLNGGKFFFGLFFLDRNTGWLGGDGQWILKTSNGGLSFDSAFISGRMYDIYFKDFTNGLTWGSGGLFYRSTNGGINWNSSSVLGETASFFDMSIIGDICWTIGNTTRKIYKSTNFGLTWDSLSRITGTNSNLGSIYFSSLNNGWVSGDSGKIYKTTNGGYNWYRQNVPITVGYSGIFFIDDTTGWAAGNVGIILHTTSGGLIVNINNEITEMPINNRLYPCFPNPFNSITVIKYELTKQSKIKIIIYDVLGRKLKVILDDIINRGIHKIVFESSNLSSGIYFYTLIIDEKFSDTKKFLLIK